MATIVWTGSGWRPQLGQPGQLGPRRNSRARRRRHDRRWRDRAGRVFSSPTARASLSPRRPSNNQGEITVGSTSSLTDLVWDGSTTLQGGGRIALSDDANNRITSTTAGSVLTNVDNTISGSGQITDLAAWSLVNQIGGTIEATGVNSLDISVDQFTNDGTLRAIRRDAQCVRRGSRQLHQPDRVQPRQSRRRLCSHRRHL